MPKQQREKKKRDIHREKALYRCARYHRERAHFFATVNGGGERGTRHAEVGERTTTISGFARIRIAVVPIVRFPLSLPLSFLSSLLSLSFFASPSSSSSSSSLSFSFPSFAAPSRVFPSTRFSRSPWVDRSQHRLRFGLPSYIPIFLPTYSRSTSSCEGRGRPDLSPLNGINKLYYACTSP